VLYLVTGSQGEPRAAMQRIAIGNHQRVRLEAGDTVIFSSKIIPGNEKSLYALHNLLVELGVEVITEEDHFVHVSGHPSRDEMEQMVRWMKPKVVVPVHGEARHLYAHARFAKGLGVEQALVVRNGDLVRLGPLPAGVEEEVPVGRRVLETDELLDSADELYRSRRRLASHGTVVVGVVLDPYGSVLATPRLTCIGAIDLSSFGDLEKEAAELIADAVEDLPDREVMDDERVEQVVRTALRQALSLPRSKRPIVEVQITRLSAQSLDSLEDDKVGAA
jgi:ribonuclease J